DFHVTGVQTCALPISYDDLLALAGLAWETVTVDGPHTPPWNGLDPPDLAINLHGRGPQSVRALAALRPRRLWTHRGTEQAAAREIGRAAGRAGAGVAW